MWSRKCNYYFCNADAETGTKKKDEWLAWGRTLNQKCKYNKVSATSPFCVVWVYAGKDGLILPFCNYSKTFYLCPNMPSYVPLQILKKSIGWFWEEKKRKKSNAWKFSEQMRNKQTKHLSLECHLHLWIRIWTCCWWVGKAIVAWTMRLWVDSLGELFDSFTDRLPNVNEDEKVHEKSIMH